MYICVETAILVKVYRRLDEHVIRTGCVAAALFCSFIADDRWGLIPLNAISETSVDSKTYDTTFKEKGFVYALVAPLGETRSPKTKSGLCGVELYLPRMLFSCHFHKKIYCSIITVL